MDYRKIYGICNGCKNYRILDHEGVPCPQCHSEHLDRISDDINIIFFDTVTDNGGELPVFIVRPEAQDDIVEKYLEEKKLYGKERNELKDSDFGLPKKRKYPLIDKVRIQKAIQFFKYCPQDDKKELGKNIVRKVKELKLQDEIHVSKDNEYKKYFPELVSESSNVIDTYDNELHLLIESFIHSNDRLELFDLYESISYVDDYDLRAKIYNSLIKSLSDISETTIYDMGITSDGEKLLPIFIIMVGKSEEPYRIEKPNQTIEYFVGVSLNNNLNKIFTITPEFSVNSLLNNNEFVDSYYVYATMIPVSAYSKLENFIKETADSSKDISDLEIHVSADLDTMKLSCLHFIDRIIKRATGSDIVDNNIVLVSSGEKTIINIHNIKEDIKVLLNVYNTKIVQEIKANIDIRTDHDGVIIIKKKEKIDFMNFYARSHRLLIEYEKVNNLESIKYELAKLWFMNVVIERKIIHTNFNFASKKKIDDAKKARAFILNDFTKYLRFILSKQPTFNFQAYYEKTEFGIETYRIDKNAIIMMGEIIKGLLIK